MRTIRLNCSCISFNALYKNINGCFLVELGKFIQRKNFYVGGVVSLSYATHEVISITNTSNTWEKQVV